ncbi:FAD-dependent oxidoreductase [Caulobacter segnis]|uniref:FAD-dependent oxidoreductase n=1 Tax=Caulobacter segnis TaxID=88688 RepID=UPI0028671730|nr:FAD-dependent oxidoreductase [Caulobacter segnis]MDR6624314.1 uncharacterized protein with NAD-binding domain and iron-sulfur cluster [Caulobacter segnis]
MARKKIAILGGGMAGLTTAYYLTKTPELRAQYEVTVHQMGWRLGGKAASGRDRQGRNLEHGLHVWFGYYDCAFRLLQEVYAAYTPPETSPFKTWTDAFKPQKHTGIGMLVDDRWTHLSVDWPENDGQPGDPKPIPPLGGALALLLGWLRDAILDRLPGWEPLLEEQDPEASDSLLFLAAARTAFGFDNAALAFAEAVVVQPRLSLPQAMKVLSLWLHALGGDLTGLGHAHLDAIVRLLRLIDAQYRAFHQGSNDPAVIMIGHLLNVFAATMAGAVADLIKPNLSFETIDDWDFSDWLIYHGADEVIARTSSLVRIIYDISFQYTDGDPARPTCAAGSGLGSVVRMLATYKGAMMYHVQGGFGDAVIAPLYAVLKDNGVKFEFFHKVTALERDGDRVGRVRMEVQAAVSAQPYRPEFEICGLTSWPTEPHWDQLVDGDRLRDAGVNFESHWCQEPPIGEVVLKADQDYDQVVLAIPLGGYKPMEGDPGICADLFTVESPLRRFAENVDITPTLAFQFWSDRTLPQLGWTTGKSATVSGPQPFDIWADMSQVLDVEPWPEGAGPKTLHYFCGSYPTRLYAAPPSDAGVPERAATELRVMVEAWLKTGAEAWFPLASRNGTFDWTALWDPSGATGSARLNNQFLRANIDPTECCVSCAAGQTRYRLYPLQSGFSNLVLTGEGTRHGLNATAVEAAVMSGMASARAISGSPRQIPGYDFLSRKPIPES